MINHLPYTHTLCQHKYNTERQKKRTFSEPTQSFCWRDIGMVPKRKKALKLRRVFEAKRCACLEPVQDLWITLDMKTMCAFSRNKLFFTKSCHCQTYQNYEHPPWTSQNSYFQSHFSVLKIGQFFPKNNSMKTRRPTFIKKCFENFDF